MTGDVLIIGAVPEELAYLSERLESRQESNVGGRRIQQGKRGRLSLSLLTGGPGMANTVQALTAALEHKKPRLIIQTGCAGAFAASGLNTGDIGIADAEIDIHLGMEPEDGDTPLAPLPFPVLKSDGREILSRYPLDADLAEKARRIIMDHYADRGVRVKKGPFITVSTITATDKRADGLYRAFSPLMENMEGAGAAHTALHYGVPFLEIRCASNRAGRRDRDRWNLPLAFERAGEALKRLLDDKFLNS